MLKHLAQFIATKVGASRSGPAVKVFVDTAPVMEKPLAAAAGLGWQGKHTNLVSRVPTAPGCSSARSTPRWSCRRTRRTPTAAAPARAAWPPVPTNAFPAPYRLDATRCISYLTIEHRGPIPTRAARR